MCVGLGRNRHWVRGYVCSLYLSTPNREDAPYLQQCRDSLYCTATPIYLPIYPGRCHKTSRTRTCSSAVTASTARRLSSPALWAAL